MSVLLRDVVSLRLHPPPDYVSDHIRRERDFYEADILAEIQRRLDRQPPGVIVDAGAMLGNHTAYMAAFVAHTAIHAFEPAPVNLNLLLRNTLAFRDTVSVHPVALSDRAGQVAMAVPSNNRGHGVITATDPWPEDNGPEFLVEAITLDSLELEHVTLIKVDVEWHEPQVIAGARETIDRWHPLIVIEDWKHVYGDLLPDYRLAAEWEQKHQTFMYEWGG